MELIDKIPPRIIELELQIKLLDYLKRTKKIENDMYDYLVNKLLIKLKQEKTLPIKKVRLDYKYFLD